MADNAHSNISSKTVSPPMAVQMTGQTSIFAGNDAKRMSFDGSLPHYNLSQSPSSYGLSLTTGLAGGSYNRDRRDSLKHMVHLQDFGTD